MINCIVKKIFAHTARVIMAQHGITSVAGLSLVISRMRNREKNTIPLRDLEGANEELVLQMGKKK